MFLASTWKQGLLAALERRMEIAVHFTPCVLDPYPQCCQWSGTAKFPWWQVTLDNTSSPYGYSAMVDIKSPEQQFTTEQNVPKCELSVKSTQARLHMTGTILPVMYWASTTSLVLWTSWHWAEQLTWSSTAAAVIGTVPCTFNKGHTFMSWSCSWIHGHTWYVILYTPGA